LPWEAESLTSLFLRHRSSSGADRLPSRDD
jgi:hypothetical protein